MPKYTEKTAKVKAKKLIKVYVKNDFNQSKTAKELGVTQPCISDRLSKAPVQEALQDIINRCLDKAGITKEKVYKQLDNQLSAKRKLALSNEEEDDWNSQDKARKDALTLMGHLKPAAEANKPTEIIIQYGYRETSPVRDETGREDKST
jgi:predicted transcriptional regulator